MMQTVTDMRKKVVGTILIGMLKEDDEYEVIEVTE